MAHGAVRQAVASFDQLMEVFQQGVQWRKLGEFLACCSWPTACCMSDGPCSVGRCQATYMAAVAAEDGRPGTLLPHTPQCRLPAHACPAGATNMNDRSSRSHAIFTLLLTRLWTDRRGKRLRCALPPPPALPAQLCLLASTADRLFNGCPCAGPGASCTL